MLQKTIACVQSVFGGMPFVNKNVKYLLRIGVLGKIFPASKFLVVERDITDVAKSILRGRYENLSDPTKWWSVKPSNYDKLKDLPVAEQIARQCISLIQKMENDLSKLPSERIVRIHYEDFCKNPEGLIRKIMISIDATKTKNPAQQCFKIQHRNPRSTEEIDLVNLVGKLKN